MNEIIHNYKKNNFQYNFIRGCEDLGDSIKNWRIFSTLGINDIRRRYIRSRLGQFWLTLSLAVNIGTLGIVFSYLFKMPTDTFLPYVAISLIFWTFIGSTINDGSIALISNTNYLQELTIGKSSYIFSLFIRNIIILFHNLLILIPLSFLCTFFTSINAIFLSLCGFLLTVIFLFPIVLVASIISLRYRDLPNVINSIMQIVLYITPIMWRIELMPEGFQKSLILNPFAIFLALCRDPFITDVISPHYQYWMMAIFYVILSWLVGFSFFCQFRQRITYWL